MSGAISPDNQEMPFCFQLIIIDDDVVELNETLSIFLSSNDSAVRVGGQLNVTIIDNDSKSLHLS